MKLKKIPIIAATLFLSTAMPLTACSKTTKTENSPTPESSVSAPEASSDSIAGTDTSSSSSEESGSSVTDDTSQQQPEATEPASYSFDEYGAVIVENEKDYSDTELLDAAQALFDSACEVEWKYTVGCPYEVDYETYIENEFEWQFYKIKSPEITSLADIETDYYRVFSSEYPNKLSELYKESDGAVYALCGERGKDLYYVDSKITGVSERSDKEITFTVENHYSGNDFTGEEPYSETDTFSVVIYEDGTWRAGEFNLPF